MFSNIVSLTYFAIPSNIMMIMAIKNAMMKIMIVRIMRNDNDGGYGFIDCWGGGESSDV